MELLIGVCIGSALGMYLTKKYRDYNKVSVTVEDGLVQNIEIHDPKIVVEVVDKDLKDLQGLPNYTYYGEPKAINKVMYNTDYNV